MPFKCYPLLLLYKTHTVESFAGPGEPFNAVDQELIGIHPEHLSCVIELRPGFPNADSNQTVVNCCDPEARVGLPQSSESVSG
jgi:hypothetical protein